MPVDGVDTLAVVTDAVALVVEADPAGLTPETTLDSLDADSLVRVGVADVIEDHYARRGVELHIDDATLARVASLGDVVASVDAALDAAGAPLGHTVVGSPG